jgi:hypothetical protein
VLAAEQPNEGAVHVLRFPNGNRALCVTEDVERDSNTGALLARLKLDVPSRPVIVVCGGADDLVGRRLRHVESVLGAAVALAAGAHGAAVVDGGTAAGVMAVIGSARKHREKAMPLLIGVAPSERIGEVEDPLEDIARFEAHHTHFVLARSDSWGGETGLMFRVADSLAGPKRAVVVLAGGGDVAAKEVLEAVQRGWPVIVLSRSGGLAKDLANVWRRTQPSMWRAVRWFRSVRAQAHLLIQRDSEATLRPIARDGDLRLFGDHDAPELARWLAWEFSDDEALKDGWRLYASTTIERPSCAVGLDDSKSRSSFWASSQRVSRWRSIKSAETH